MKKTIVWLILLAVTSVFAANMGKFDPHAQVWHVTGNRFKCTFFEGCMYPAWLTSPKAEECPFFVLDDYFTVGKETFRLIEERWAEFKIKENSSKRFVISCSGWFCNGLPPYNKPCKDVRLTYVYTLERDSSVLKIDVSIEKKKAEEIRFYLIRPRWRFLPFERLETAEGKVIDLKQRFVRPGMFTCNGAKLLHPAFTVKFSSGVQQVRWENRENGFLTVSEKSGEIVSPAKQKVIKYSTSIDFAAGVK